MHIKQFSENAFGDLVLSTDLGVPTSTTHREFEVNKDTLSISASTNSEETGDRAFPIPWSIQKNALTSFVPLDVAAKGISAHAQDTVKARLVIGRGGAVENVTISVLSAALAGPIRDAILQWKFKPTLLNGRQVEVATEFSSPISELTKIPD